MSSMIKSYWNKVPSNIWQQLFDLLFEKQQLLLDGIDKDEMPKRKQKACEALKKLFDDLSNSLAQPHKTVT